VWCAISPARRWCGRLRRHRVDEIVAFILVLFLTPEGLAWQILAFLLFPFLRHRQARTHSSFRQDLARWTGRDVRRHPRGLLHAAVSGGDQKHPGVKYLLALCCCIALSAQAETFTAKVIVVMDGDTVMVLREGQKIKIRLANIDAPEVGHAGMGGKAPNSQKAQPFGKQSRDSLLEMVGKKQVQIDSQAGRPVRRLVGLISVDGLNINEEQVRRGMAWEYSHYHRDKTYRALQSEARQAQRGLWAQYNPQAPWEWAQIAPVLQARPARPLAR